LGNRAVDRSLACVCCGLRGGYRCAVFEPLKYNIQRRTSNAEHPTLNIQRWISDSFDSAVRSVAVQIFIAMSIFGCHLEVKMPEIARQ
jgi:hypothetical protein